LGQIILASSLAEIDSTEGRLSTKNNVITQISTSMPCVEETMASALAQPQSVVPEHKQDQGPGA